MIVRRIYGMVLREFGLNEFSVLDFKEAFGFKNPSLILYRMCKNGYVTRVSRGVFRATHPIVLALESSGYPWRSKVAQKEYLPILEYTVASLFHRLWRRLFSIILFGSVAGGRAKPESDIDLLVIAESLPRNYSDRLKLFRETTVGVEELRLELWKKRGIYPLLSPIMLTPEEASINQPFYLDMLDESVIIFDKGGFMRNRLKELRSRLAELGARKVRLPDGSWCWELKPSIKPGEVVEV